jgi:hypothetical protein
MIFTDLTDFLSDNDLVSPDLACLHPDNDHYSSLLFQPGGMVVIRDNYIGPGTSQIIRDQLADFFRNAKERQVNLAVIPEYCCPLHTIQETIQNDIRPLNRNLWIIGVEAITIQQLEDFKTTLSPTVKVIWEPDLQTSQGSFLDPVFYIFQSQNISDELTLVIVVQFKTYPMADFIEIERTHMVRGEKIFVFNKNNPNMQKLTTLICSDTLSREVQDQICDPRIYDRCLIVHIQLNPNPRKDVFKRYRNIVFDQDSNQTELLCLNWSTEIQSIPSGAFKDMLVCGSAIYLKSQHVDRQDNDDQIRLNHRLGLYTTYWQDKQAFCFFFNFQPAVYHYHISKAFQQGPAVQSRRRGPIMSTALTWNVTTNSWMESQLLSDNFSVVCSDVDSHGLQYLYDQGYDPLNIERLMNLSIGIAYDTEWFRIRKLQTHQIGIEEKIYCLTFAQDKDQQVSRQRASYLGLFCKLQHVIQQRALWPIWMKQFGQTVEIKYQPENPNRNIVDENGLTATGIYWGSYSASNLAILYQKLENLLSTETIHRQNQNAIAIWYHQNGQDLLYRADVRPTILNDYTEFSNEIDRS